MGQRTEDSCLCTDENNKNQAIPTVGYRTCFAVNEQPLIRELDYYRLIAPFHLFAREQCLILPTKIMLISICKSEATRHAPQPPNTLLSQRAELSLKAIFPKMGSGPDVAWFGIPCHTFLAYVAPKGRKRISKRSTPC